MVRKWEWLAALALTAACFVPESGFASDAPEFDFTAKEIITRINAAMKNDGPDQIKNCRKSGKGTECIFTDKSFQQAVAGFKKMNLLNGRFEQDLKLTIAETPGGKVASIMLAGTRGDPVNLVHSPARS